MSGPGQSAKEGDEHARRGVTSADEAGTLRCNAEENAVVLGYGLIGLWPKREKERGAAFGPEMRQELGWNKPWARRQGLALFFPNCFSYYFFKWVLNSFEP